jgi:hypothetical protein
MYEFFFLFIHLADKRVYGYGDNSHSRIYHQFPYISAMQMQVHEIQFSEFDGTKIQVISCGNYHTSVLLGSFMVLLTWCRKW